MTSDAETDTRPGIRSHCPYCAFQCGMRLAITADQRVEVAGDPDFPLNRGQLCVKGAHAAELLRHSERLLTPLVRHGGVLQPTSWDLALEGLAARIRDLQKRYGADALGVFGSGALTNEKAYALGKFARVVLGTPFLDYNGRYCMASAASALNQALGLDRGLPFPFEDIARCRCVVVWGSNWADTLPPGAQWFEEQRQRGGSLIVVDPRRSATALAADLHLQLTPGSDLALANGMLFVALDEGLIDEGFIAERTVGFARIRSIVLDYWPARVERWTGVSEARMRRATRLLAQAPTAMLLSGRGAEQQSKGVDTVLALINLMLALGKMGKPYCGFGTLTGQGNGQGGREHGQKADQLPGYRSLLDPAQRAQVARAWGVAESVLSRPGKSAFELLDSLGPQRPDGGGGIRGLFVMGSNVLVASPDQERIRGRLESLDLLTVCDSFLNETAERADFVLPVLQWAEETGTLTNLEGRVILRRQAVSPPEGPRSDLWILRELSRRLGNDTALPSVDPEGVFRELAQMTAGAKADYSGITYEKIVAQDGVFWPCPRGDHPGTPRVFLDRFGHADGKARFIPVEHRDAAELPDAEFPWYFITGRYKEHYNSGVQTRRVGALMERRPWPRLEVHPRLLDRLGIADGAMVLAESRRGGVVFQAAASVAIRPDTVFAPFHWGGKAAANTLTNPALDPQSRMPEFKICAVRLRPVAPHPSATARSTPGPVQNLEVSP